MWEIIFWKECFGLLEKIVCQYHPVDNLERRNILPRFCMRETTQRGYLEFLENFVLILCEELSRNGFFANVFVSFPASCILAYKTNVISQLDPPSSWIRGAPLPPPAAPPRQAKTWSGTASPSSSPRCGCSSGKRTGQGSRRTRRAQRRGGPEGIMIK